MHRTLDLGRQVPMIAAAAQYIVGHAMQQQFSHDRNKRGRDECFPVRGSAMQRIVTQAQQYVASVSCDGLHRMMLPHRLLNMTQCTLFNSVPQAYRLTNL